MNSAPALNCRLAKTERLKRLQTTNAFVKSSQLVLLTRLINHVTPIEHLETKISVGHSCLKRPHLLAEMVVCFRMVTLNQKRVLDVSRGKVGCMFAKGDSAIRRCVRVCFLGVTRDLLNTRDRLGRADTVLCFEPAALFP